MAIDFWLSALTVLGVVALALLAPRYGADSRWGYGSLTRAHSWW
jgi:hypothetical protein